MTTHHRQLFGPTATTPRRSRLLSALWVVLVMAGVIGCYALAIHWDAQAQATQTLAQATELQARTEMLAHIQTGLQTAYKQGRRDALQPRPGTPEQSDLAQACAARGVRP